MKRDSWVLDKMKYKKLPYDIMAIEYTYKPEQAIVNQNSLNTNCC